MSSTRGDLFVWQRMCGIVSKGSADGYPAPPHVAICFDPLQLVVNPRRTHTRRKETETWKSALEKHCIFWTCHRSCWQENLIVPWTPGSSQKKSFNKRECNADPTIVCLRNEHNIVASHTFLYTVVQNFPCQGPVQSALASGRDPPALLCETKDNAQKYINSS